SAAPLPIITTYERNSIVMVRWGFVPEGFCYPNMRPENNARLATAATNPSFRSSFSGRHWLVLTYGSSVWVGGGHSGGGGGANFRVRRGSSFNHNSSAPLRFRTEELTRSAR